jgi:hypothetical protein
VQEYVILLLRGGICKDDACRKLNVFLEDDSTSFISWLVCAVLHSFLHCFVLCASTVSVNHYQYFSVVYHWELKNLLNSKI